MQLFGNSFEKRYQKFIRLLSFETDDSFIKIETKLTRLELVAGIKKNYLFKFIKMY